MTSWRLAEGEEIPVDLRREQRRVRKLLRSLGLGGHPTLPELIAAYEQRSGRRLMLTEREMVPGEPSGAYERYLAEDRIFYPANTSRGHQLLVVCHELAHLLLDTHVPTLDAIDPEVAIRVLGRSHYDDPAERQAETVGRLLALTLNLDPEQGPAAHVASSMMHREGRHV